MEEPLLSLDSDMSVMEAVPLSFFLDLNAFFQLRYDLARGYFVLLATEEADPNMRVAALVEGNAIDVLFGGDKARAQPAKMYLCNRTHDEKMAAVQFYTHVFRAAMEYQQQKRDACCCGCCGACWCCGRGAREEAEAKLNIAFQEMQKAGLM